MIRIRMSSGGYCSKRLTAMLLGREGAPVPKWLSESAKEGNWHEERLKAELRELGCEVIDDQLEISIPTNGRYEVVGHIDGRVKPSYKLFHDSNFNVHYLDCSPQDINDEFFQHFHLGEMKSFSFLEHQRWVVEVFDGYFYHYAVQHTLYRHASNETGITLLFSKDRSGGARNLYVIGKDPADFSVLPAKFDEVVRCAEAGELPFAEYNPESLECRRCAYRITQCVGKLPNVTDMEVVIAAQDYLDGAAQEKDGKALKEQAREVLLSYSIANKLTKWNVGDFSINYSSFSREDISVKPVHVIIEKLRALLLSETVTPESVQAIVDELEAAISVSPVNRITVANLKRED